MGLNVSILAAEKSERKKNLGETQFKDVRKYMFDNSAFNRIPFIFHISESWGGRRAKRTVAALRVVLVEPWLEAERVWMQAPTLTGVQGQSRELQQLTNAVIWEQSL